MINFKAFLISSCILSMCIGSSGHEVHVYTDSMAPGWTYMDTCISFEIRIDSLCDVKWTVIKNKAEHENPDGKLRLKASPYDSRRLRDCSYSFEEIADIHKTILDSIFSTWPSKRFSGLSYSSFSHGNDYSWNIPIAIASSRSKEYREHREMVPSSPYNVNSLFVQFANQTDAYGELASLFSTHSLVPHLMYVEKVFVSLVRDLPFKKDLIDKGLKENSKVIWDVGMSYFSLNQKDK